MEVIEEKNCLVACMEDGYTCPYRESSNGICNVHDNLADVEKILIDELKKHSLHDMFLEGKDN